jgi:hypothetical protein
VREYPIQNSTEQQYDTQPPPQLVPELAFVDVPFLVVPILA